jgi:hypothetical protein
MPGLAHPFANGATEMRVPGILIENALRLANYVTAMVRHSTSIDAPATQSLDKGGISSDEDELQKPPRVGARLISSTSKL